MNYSNTAESSCSVNASEDDMCNNCRRPSSHIDKPFDKVTVTVLGETRTLAGLERTEWIFLILSVSCILTIIGLTIERLTTLQKDSSDYLFAILLLINAGFCLFYAVHGVLREREYELYCLIVAILFVSVYVIVNYVLLTTSSSIIKKIRIILVVVFVPFIIGFAWVVGQGFGYLEFITVGAGTEVQAMYRAAIRFSGLLKFDFQLVVILITLTIVKCNDVSYFAKCTIATGIPLQLLAALIGWISMRTEQLVLVWIILPLYIVEPVYIAVRISQFAERWHYYTSKDMAKSTYSFIAIAACAIIIRVLLMRVLYVVVKNFGRGLKYKVFQLPRNENDPPALARKRNIKTCCGIVCRGPIG